MQTTKERGQETESGYISLIETCGLIEEIRPIIKDDPVEYIESHIDLTDDDTASSDGFIKLDTYQKEPISAWDEPLCRKLTIIAPEQTGKSTCGRVPVTWKINCDPVPICIIYESDDKAEQVNTLNFEPIFNRIPAMKRQLSLPFAKTKDHYKFEKAPLYFTGAGSELTTFSYGVIICEEIDDWKSANEKNVHNLQKADNRLRTYDQSLRVIPCTPKRQSDPAWKEFVKSSQGYWHMKCLNKKCKEYIISHALVNLQWNTDKDGGVVEKSIRLICPHCQHEHKQNQAQKMNDKGKYIHKFANRKEHLGFQWGALACPRVKALSWAKIAEAQMEAGKNATHEAHMTLDNSYRGLPLQKRKINESQEQSIANHLGKLPKPDDVVEVFFSADTQDNGWWFVIRAMTENGNTYLINEGFVMTVDELDKKWNMDWYGLTPRFGIIDEGGHGDRPATVKEFVRNHPGMFSYKGNSRIGSKWQYGKKDKRLLSANPWMYHEELLFLIYEHNNKDNGYWWLPENIRPDYVEQITCFWKDNEKKNGHEYRNWTRPHDSKDHLFDAEKMLLVLLDAYRDHLRRKKGKVSQNRTGKKVSYTEDI